MINVNCGVLGHVDSGKTALCRLLSQIHSTAALDKHPQSQERGITLDLGFSSFVLPKVGSSGEAVQITLVDCPGHASLLRTVIGGAQIMDSCILVLDAQKGFQVQSAECLVIAEIVTSKLIVVCNKIDLIPADSRQQYLSKFHAGVRKVLSKTRFSKDTPIINVSAISGEGSSDLVAQFSKTFETLPRRSPGGPLHFAFDHCFSIKGHGTVFTGTVLSGTVRQGQMVSMPNYQQNGEVRSIQRFRESVTSAIQGDRVGLCIPGVPAGDKERGDIFDNSSNISAVDMLLLCVKRIPHCKAPIVDHPMSVSIGHSHAVGNPVFFTQSGGNASIDTKETTPHAAGQGYGLSQSALRDDLDLECMSASALLDNVTVEFEVIHTDKDLEKNRGVTLCLVFLDRRLPLLEDTLVLGSRLDLDSEYQGCRLAMYGRCIGKGVASLRNRLVRHKVKEGSVERIHGSGEFLVKNILKKENRDPSKYIGKAITHTATGCVGVIDSSFGKSGLLRVSFPNAPGDIKVGDSVQFHSKQDILDKLLRRHGH